MAEPDYEALGRYVHLCEQVKKKAAERGRLLDDAKAVDAELLALIQEANELAPLADRPVLGLAGLEP